MLPTATKNNISKGRMKYPTFLKVVKIKTLKDYTEKFHSTISIKIKKW